ncbi:ABC transporter permease [Phosphitispora sp. TUW77]|uniref:ABC transporter permease n=1 Tax=Phosphitispora sp. TUW77 TaxID=3152361 RepID=UPI003AB1AA1F
MHINYWQEIKSNNIGRLGLIFLIIIVSAAVFSPLFFPFDPAGQSQASFQPPSGEHWLGTNDVGQDIFSQLLYGARTSLLAAVLVAFLSTVISAFIGATAGYQGGIYEKVVMRLVDAFLVIPPMLLIIIIAAYVQPGLWQLILLLSLLSWPGGARIIRSQTLVLKEKTHVWASKTFGASMVHILTRHIIPDLGPVLAAVMIQSARRAVFMEAGLSFLGVMDPMTISWGKMLYHSMKYVYLDVWQWWLLPVGILLSLTVMSFTFIGYSLEEAMDPRLRRGRHA